MSRTKRATTITRRKNQHPTGSGQSSKISGSVQLHKFTDKLSTAPIFIDPIFLIILCLNKWNRAYERCILLCKLETVIPDLSYLESMNKTVIIYDSNLYLENFIQLMLGTVACSLEFWSSAMLSFAFSRMFCMLWTCSESWLTNNNNKKQHQD